MKHSAHVGALTALIIGLIATVVVGGIGVAVSIRVSNNGTDWCVNCLFNQNNTKKEITVNADSGKLYWALENGVDKATTYKVSYKGSKGGSYSQKWKGSLGYQKMVGYKYVDKTNGWTKRYFKIQQLNNLSSKATHAYFYAEVRK